MSWLSGCGNQCCCFSPFSHCCSKGGRWWEADGGTAGGCFPVESPFCYYGLVEINSKARLRNVNDVFVFAKQCQQIYYTYTSSFRNDRSRVDWLSILKMKPRGRVEVVQDENEDTSVGDDVFQVTKLVEPYQFAPLIDLEKNSIFCVFDNSLVDVELRS